MSTKYRAGKISVKLFNRLQEFGFTDIENIQELIDNSLDANAKNIYIITENKDNYHYLYFVDDGVGMNKDGMIKYYEIAEDKDKESFNGKYPIGSKGMGGKIATINLSNRSEVSIISRDKKDKWVEASYNWSSEEYINQVHVSTKQSVEDKDLINHIFNNILKINEPDTFTVIYLKLDTKIFNNMFDFTKQIDAEDSILFNLGITYYRFLNNGINISIINNNEIQKIKPIHINFTKHEKTFFPNEIIQLTDPKKIQVKGGPNYTKYYNDVSLIYNRNYTLCKNGDIYEYNGNKIYKYDGIYGKNQHVQGRFTDRIEIKNESINLDKIVDFKIKHTYYYYDDYRIFTNKIKENINNDNIIIRKESCNKIFYGTHFIRNGKTIFDSAIDFKEPKAGDYYSRYWNYSQFILEFKSDSHDIDKYFGIMVNKSSLNKTFIHPSIIKLINYLIYENKIEFEKDYDIKINKFNNNLDSKDNSKDNLKNEIKLGSKDNLKNEIKLESKDNSKDISKNSIERKSRKHIPNTNKKILIKCQDKKDNITGVKFSDFIRYEIDHIDGNPSNNNEDNLQAISVGLHSIKTNKREIYDRIVNNPIEYNLHNGLAYLDNSITLNALSSENKKKMHKICKELEKIIESLNDN